MGYFVQHAIIVSSWDEKLLRATRRKAKAIFAKTQCAVTEITPMANNSERSFFVATDGSKRGWKDSVKGYHARTKFLDYLRDMKPYPPAYALVQYGDDGGHDYVVESNHVERQELVEAE